MIKNRLLFIITILMISIAGCEGPTGPKGEPGIDGADGVSGTDGSDGSDGADGAANIQTYYASWENDDSYINPPESGSSILSKIVFDAPALTEEIAREGVVMAHFTESLLNDTEWDAMPYTYIADSGNTVQITYKYSPGTFEVLFVSLSGDFVNGDQLEGRVKITLIPPSEGAAKQKAPDLQSSEGYKALLKDGYFDRKE